MKRLIFLVYVTVFLGACTSNELKQLALQHAEKTFAAELKKELEGVMPPEHPLYETYIHYLVTSAEYEVEDLTKSSEQMQIAQVLAKVAPQKNRRVLAEIAAKRKLEHEAKSFNLGTALVLIEKQPGQTQGLEEKRYFLRLTRSGGGWKAEPLGSN